MTAFPRTKHAGLDKAYNECASLRNLQLSGYSMEDTIIQLAEQLNKANAATKMETMRADQCAVNNRFLIETIDAIHADLCKGPGGSWQMRANEARAMANHIKVVGDQLTADVDRLKLDIVKELQASGVLVEPTMKYRPHRGSFDEAIAEMKVIPSTPSGVETSKDPI